MTKRSPYLTDGQYTVEFPRGQQHPMTYLSEDLYQVTQHGHTIEFKSVRRHCGTYEDERILRRWVRDGRIIISGPLAVEVQA